MVTSFNQSQQTNMLKPRVKFQYSAHLQAFTSFADTMSSSQSLLQYRATHSSWGPKSDTIWTPQPLQNLLI